MSADEKRGCFTRIVLIAVVVAIGVYFVYRPRSSTIRDDGAHFLATSRFKQNLLAIHDYQDLHDHLPGNAIRNDAGKPLLSWRVAILPFIEEEALYKRFKLDEPWDSPHNIALLKEMPQTYALPNQIQPRWIGVRKLLSSRS